MSNQPFQTLLDEAGINLDHKTIRDVMRLLVQKTLTISVAESLTGGLIGSKLSQLPGSSTVFVGGVVCYNPLLKIKLCGVKPATIQSNGIVSDAVAKEMAEGIARLTQSHLAISSTGLAGPAGDQVSPVPIGTVYIGFSFLGTVESKQFHFKGNRDEVRSQAVKAALGYLRNWLLHRS